VTSLRPLSLVPLALGGVLMALPVSGLPMGELQALNRELGRLCSDPPREALAVCRIHARLVRAL
jgi:Na+-transporting methylmalonyl-CoA/oxaloacetate decarboxylase beta subunit